MFRKWFVLTLLVTFLTSVTAYADWSNSGDGHGSHQDKQIINNGSSDFQKYKDPEDDDPLIEPSDEDEGVIFWLQYFFPSTMKSLDHN